MHLLTVVSVCSLPNRRVIKCSVGHDDAWSHKWLTYQGKIARPHVNTLSAGHHIQSSMRSCNVCQLFFYKIFSSVSHMMPLWRWQHFPAFMLLKSCCNCEIQGRNNCQSSYDNSKRRLAGFTKYDSCFAAVWTAITGRYVDKRSLSDAAMHPRNQPNNHQHDRWRRQPETDDVTGDDDHDDDAVRFTERIYIVVSCRSFTIKHVSVEFEFN